MMSSLNVKEFMEGCISVVMKNIEIICVDEAHRWNTCNNQ